MKKHNAVILAFVLILISTLTAFTKPVPSPKQKAPAKAKISKKTKAAAKTKVPKKTTAIKTLQEIKKQNQQSAAKYVKQLEIWNSSNKPEDVVKGAHFLRDIGRYKDAVAQYDKYEKLFQASDPTALQYAETGKKFAMNQKNLKLEGGVYLYAVAPGGAGEAAGLAVGDIIIRYYNKTTSTLELFEQAKALAEKDNAASVSVEFLRLGSDGTFTRNTIVMPSGKMGLGLMIM